MLRKDEILERTNNGLNVFRHYISVPWRVGRNFLNPLYEDSKASCNIYFDRKSGTYKMKDFGNDSFSGDCFFLTGHLNGLDCGNTSDFVEILQIIDRDLSLGLSDYTPSSIPKSKSIKPVETMPTPDRKSKPYTFKEQPLSEQEYVFWRQYGIGADTLTRTSRNQTGLIFYLLFLFSSLVFASQFLYLHIVCLNGSMNLIDLYYEAAY